MFRHTVAGVVLLTLVALIPASATAATWQVRQDGSGDFTTIQAAIDASAPGDTIRIGAGRYLDYAYMSVGGNFNANVYVNVHVDNLTFIGEGVDATIIGPTTFHAEPPYGPIGFLVFSDVSRVRLEDLRVDHIYTGMYRWLGRLETERCAFSECRTGIVSWTEAGMDIHASSFMGNTNNGIVAFSYCENATIVGCVFANNMSNVYFGSAQNSNVYQCEFLSGTTGVTFSEGASGAVSDCRFENIDNTAVVITLYSSAILERNSIVDGGEAVYVEGRSHLSGSDNRFEHQTYSAIEISNSTVDFDDNQFIDPVRWSVKLPYGSYVSPPTVEIDLTNNFWGTDDPAQIDEWIWDEHDDPNIHAVVVYEPFIPVMTPVADLPAASGLRLEAVPNPFNPRTTIRFSTVAAERATCAVYDLRGRQLAVLADGTFAAGDHEVAWDGCDRSGHALAAGVYVVRLVTESATARIVVSLIR